MVTHHSPNALFGYERSGTLYKKCRLCILIFGLVWFCPSLTRRFCCPPRPPQQWYGGEHKAPALQAEAVYGLTELARDEVRNARLVANPGCYPTAAQLPLIALIKAGLILTEDIIIDAKSGTTGAGRAPKQGTLYCEVRGVGLACERPSPHLSARCCCGLYTPFYCCISYPTLN